LLRKSEEGHYKGSVALQIQILNGLPRLVLGLTLLVTGCTPGLPRVTGPEAARTARVTPGSAVDAPGSGEKIPERQGRINDYANLLSPQQEAELGAFYESLEQEMGCQIAVLTIESLHGTSMEDYSLKVASAWGLGRRGIDDGILITVALAEKAVRIEVGDGLKLLISTAVAQQIVQDTSPEFAAGRFFKGLEQGSLEIVHRIRTHQELVGKKKP
jgi:uncharacterized membrane protein YgcG